MKNYYEILEVNKKASKEVIEKAYKVLVKKYHPDLYTGEKQKYAEKKIKDINEAYDVLSDEFLKEQYDVEFEKEIEEMYQRKYSEKNNIKKQYSNNQKNVDNSTSQMNNQKIYYQEEKQNLGTFSGVISLTKELLKNKPKRDQFKKITQNDIIAFILTIIVIIVLGIVLWFIPFTNQWMREFLFENPLFQWIGSLFS